jgi:hypothetical protein
MRDRSGPRKALGLGLLALFSACDREPRPGSSLERPTGVVSASELTAADTAADTTASLGAPVAAPGNVGTASREVVGDAPPLALVRRFGWESLDDAERPLTARERRAEGGVLGNVAAVAEGPGATLYVLDNHFQKVVVFNPDGTLRRVILGGTGQGPGEFTRPSSLAVSEDGYVFVLDRSAARIHVFDTSGVFEQAIRLQVPNAHSLAIAGGRLYVSKLFPRAGQAAVIVLDEHGERVDSLVSTSAREAELSEFGSVGRVTRGADGQVLFAHPIPGLWTRVVPRAGAPTGVELVADVRTGIVESGPTRNARYTTASTRGAVSLRDGSVLVLYDERLTSADGSLRTLRFSAAAFDAAGRLQGVHALPEGISGALGSSATMPGVYMSTWDPYPQVLLYRVATR